MSDSSVPLIYCQAHSKAFGYTQLQYQLVLLGDWSCGQWPDMGCKPLIGTWAPIEYLTPEDHLIFSEGGRSSRSA